MSREQPEGYDRRYRCKHGVSLGPCDVCTEERTAVEYDVELDRKGRFAFDAQDDWRAE